MFKLAMFQNNFQWTENVGSSTEISINLQQPSILYKIVINISRFAKTTHLNEFLMIFSPIFQVCRIFVYNRKPIQHLNIDPDLLIAT